MLTFLSQYGYTILIIAALITFLGFLLWTLIREKKAGKSSCCGGCAGCANACYCHPQGAGDKKPTSAPAEVANNPEN